METEIEIAKAPESKITKITKYLDSDIVKTRFSGVIGDRNAGAFISSVMIAVKESKNLQECLVDSIYVSALRAATLRLSVDPSIGQAYLVPFKGIATLVVGYKGLYDMAVRTGKYRYINVSPIYAGQIVDENQITGFHSISGSRLPIGQGGEKIIGWIGAFEMNPARGQVSGFGHTIYMTVEQIHEHAKQYSKGYDYKDGNGNFTSLWHKEPEKMERKTVLRLLIRRWGYLDPADVQTLEEAENEEQEIEGSVYDVPRYDEIPERDEQAETHHKSTEENLRQMGFGG